MTITTFPRPYFVTFYGGTFYGGGPTFPLTQAEADRLLASCPTAIEHE